jgi:hypothetical protein
MSYQPIIKPEQLPAYQAYDSQRILTVLINRDICDAHGVVADGLHGTARERVFFCSFTTLVTRPSWLQVVRHRARIIFLQQTIGPFRIPCHVRSGYDVR